MGRSITRLFVDTMFTESDACMKFTAASDLVVNNLGDRDIGICAFYFQLEFF